jgi:hypothetical protein
LTNVERNNAIPCLDPTKENAPSAAPTKLQGKPPL